MTFKRIAAIFLVYLVTCFAWMVLFGVTSARTNDQSSHLRSEVELLWGESQRQLAPSLNFRAVRASVPGDPDSTPITAEEVARLGLEFPKLKSKGGKPSDSSAKNAEGAKNEKSGAGDDESAEVQRYAVRSDKTSVSLNSSHVDAFLHSDPQRKGLVWFALYDVNFSGGYVYEHKNELAGYLDIEFSLPTETAIYDELVFEVDGEDHKGALDLQTGIFKLSLPVKPGSVVSLKTGYKTRGSDDWSYRPGSKVQQLDNFHLRLSTDFSDIDFPEGTQSPTSREAEGAGWTFAWDLKSTVTGQGMGMVLPKRIQPGELTNSLIVSAPVSLLFFFVILFIVATLQKLEIHPMNYLFISAAFFAFHLLFSYSADHLTVPWAFGVSSVVSLFLVVSYLRLVVSPKFALREAGLAQLVYLVGFSLAHFWEGFTGLTVTVLAILTLYVIMQATGRLRWADVFSTIVPRKRSEAAPIPAAPLESTEGARSSFSGGTRTFRPQFAGVWTIRARRPRAVSTSSMNLSFGVPPHTLIPAATIL